VIAFYARAAPALLEADCPMRLLLGDRDGLPVSASEVFFGAGVAGIYSVATRKEFRGRGIGTALTWAAGWEAKRNGMSGAVLRSSDAGNAVYARMGFRAGGG
jgi:GNAT superfamily N-acetyltransferase